MKPTIHSFAAALLVWAACASTLRAQEPPPPDPVSPGAFDRALPASSCPTFSWSAGTAARRHQLEVRAESTSDDGRTARERLVRVELPGRARSWTPSVDRCAPPGGVYSWRMRSRSGGAWGRWSEAARFSVAPPSSLQPMRRLLEAIDRQGAPSTGPLPIADRAAATGSTPAPLLAVEPTLDIDGVLEVGELRSLFDTAALGVVETTADSAVAGDAATSGALGALRARVLRVNSDSQGGDGVQAIIVSSVLLLDTPGGSISGDAKLSVDRLGTGNLITGLPITTERSGWYPPGLDGGGSGFVEVDADNVKLDQAGESCGGKPVQGVRLRIVDGDQIGVQLQCGADPNQ